MVYLNCIQYDHFTNKIAQDEIANQHVIHQYDTMLHIHVHNIYSYLVADWEKITTFIYFISNQGVSVQCVVSAL